MRKMLSAAALALAVTAIVASTGSAQTEVEEDTKYRLMQSSMWGTIYCINAGSTCLVG